MTRRHLGPLRSAMTAATIGSLACAGCSASSSPAPSGSETADGAAPGVFVAQESDFAGFCKWSSAPATAMGDAGDGIHLAGPLTVYWNKSPPPGSHEFPVGTIILKETNETDPLKRTAFAMVKRQARGTGFNPGGADGWEWWSVSDLGCSVMRLWRGAVPGGSDSYVGTPAGDCNGCHVKAVDNDYVWDTALQLSHF